MNVNIYTERMVNLHLLMTKIIVKLNLFKLILIF